jgi:hypothetical protein
LPAKQADLSKQIACEQWAAIALLAVTLVVPRKSLLLIETPAAYAEAS